MYRTTNLLAGLLLAISSFALGQEPQLSTPQVPEDAMQTRELIAWSSLQKPQPVPQPLPPSEDPVPQPEPPSDHQARPPADADHTPVQLTGTIVKAEGRYVLRVSNAIYELQQQADVARYENQNVTVAGQLLSGSNTICVTRIEFGC